MLTPETFLKLHRLAEPFVVTPESVVVHLATRGSSGRATLAQAQLGY